MMQCEITYMSILNFHVCIKVSGQNGGSRVSEYVAGTTNTHHHHSHPQSTVWTKVLTCQDPA
ncbi:hypothetical protein BGZ63DRAFT_381245 [Mariannaea sp. PMI_226]|nr:hypothetical protein BGZ63DRAFT_381245 [Mariannaea sp. PMI_226]